MTDAYLQPEVHIIITQVPGVDGISSPARLTQIESDLALLESRPAITRLTDIPDVAGAPSDGDTILYNDATDAWEPGVVLGSIHRVSNFGDGANSSYGVNHLVLREGLEKANSAAGEVFLRPVYGTSANTVAAGNHTHSPQAPTRAIGTPSGTLSSGTRTLVSGTVTGLDSDRNYRVMAMLSCDLRGEGTGAGYTNPRIILNGVSQQRSGRVRTVAGVDREFSMWHAGIAVTGATSFPYSATLSYDEGDPINVGAGELFIILLPNR